MSKQLEISPYIPAWNLWRSFRKRITEDKRIGPAHISLYLAILQLYEQQECLPLAVGKRTIAAAAKISTTTYLRCIHQLHEFGYVIYSPSYDARHKSTIHIP